MKKNLGVAVLLLILTFPLWKALRHPGLISGHDAEAAVFKSTEFFAALSDGNFPPRWAKRLNYGLGQPTFTFLYPLPFYLTTAAMAVRNDPVLAYKLILGLTIPVGAFGAYLWLKKKFGFWPGLTGGLIYAYLPYHMVNVYVRGAIGEVVAAALLPLSFLAIDSGSLPAIALAVTLIIFAHPFYALVFGLIWAGYSGWNFKKIAAIGWGYVNAASYLIPAFVYKNLTFLNRLQEYFLEKQGFVTIKELIYSPWGFDGVDASGKALFSVQLGIILVVGFLGWMAILIFRRRQQQQDPNYRQAVFLTIVFFLAVFMMTRSSLPVWKVIPLLQSIQFPWRLLFVATPAAVFCVTYFLNKLMKRRAVLIFGLIMMLLVITSLGLTRAQRYIRWSDPAVDTGGYRGTYTLLLEETPIWHSVYDEFNQLHKYDYYHTERGDFTVKSLVWKTNYHKMEVDTPNGGILSDRTHYFPGWAVYIDGNPTKLYPPTDKYSHGLLTFEVPAGKHIVESKLSETPLELASDLISLAGIGLAIWMMLISKYGKKQSS